MRLVFLRIAVLTFCLSTGHASLRAQDTLVIFVGVQAFNAPKLYTHYGDRLFTDHRAIRTSSDEEMRANLWGLYLNIPMRQFIKTPKVNWGFAAGYNFISGKEVEFQDELGDLQQTEFTGRQTFFMLYGKYIIRFSPNFAVAPGANLAYYLTQVRSDWENDFYNELGYGVSLDVQFPVLKGRSSITAGTELSWIGQDRIEFYGLNLKYPLFIH